MPPGLAQALGPVIQQIAEITIKIKQYDRQIQQLGQTKYPETQALLKVHGVGHLTALTFVLTLGSKERFGRSRDVGLVEVSPEIMILSSASPTRAAHISEVC
jgi:transposase